PALVTHASVPVTVGGQVTDTVTLSGGVGSTGTITFRLFADAGCTSEVFSSTRPVAGNGTYASDPFTPTAPGTYRWPAADSGDAPPRPDCGPAADDGAGPAGLSTSPAPRSHPLGSWNWQDCGEPTRLGLGDRRHGVRRLRPGLLLR